MALIQIPQPKPYIHQGPTVQQTHPVPPTSNPVPAVIIAARESFRSRVPAPVALHQGATIQPTIPIPPVTVRDVQFWMPTLRDPNRLALGSGNVGPDLQFDGATIQATHPVPPIGQPDSRWTAMRDALRFVVATTRPIEGPTIQDWFLYPIAEPDFRNYRPDPNRIILGSGNLGPLHQLDGPTSQATSIFPPGQPDPRWVAGLQVPRFLVAAPPSLHQGPTVQGTFVFALSQPRIVPLVAQPSLAFPQQVVVAAAPDTLVWPQSQPRRAPLVRLVAETTLPIDGPTIQPWFLYPTSQPAPVAFTLLERARRLGGPIVQLDGPTSQQTFVFPVSQPTRRLVVLAQPRLYLPIDQTAIVLAGNEVLPKLAIDAWRWRVPRHVAPFAVATILYHSVDGSGGGGAAPSVPDIPNMSRDPGRVGLIARGRHWVKGP